MKPAQAPRAVFIQSWHTQCVSHQRAGGSPCIFQLTAALFDRDTLRMAATVTHKWFTQIGHATKAYQPSNPRGVRAVKPSAIA